MNVPATMRVNEIYGRRTVQGEGPHVGRLCTFVRLYGCNLHCRWCDTPYTWDVNGRNGVPFPRSENVDEARIEDIARHVALLGVPICVVSGGEPLMQARAVVELARQLVEDYHVETHVETNGTRPPPAPLDWVAHWSVSPKLPSADAGANAILVDVLRMWASHPRAIFKVVCGTVEDVRQAAGLFDVIGARPDARWIMPEGRTSEEVDRSSDVIVDTVLEVGANLTPRLHVSLWGMERGR